MKQGPRENSRGTSTEPLAQHGNSMTSENPLRSFCCGKGSWKTSATNNCCYCHPEQSLRQGTRSEEKDVFFCSATRPFFQREPKRILLKDCWEFGTIHDS